jgi:hypothetical protein
MQTKKKNSNIIKETNIKLFLFIFICSSKRTAAITAETSAYHVSEPEQLDQLEQLGLEHKRQLEQQVKQQRQQPERAESVHTQLRQGREHFDRRHQHAKELNLFQARVNNTAT